MCQTQVRIYYTILSKTTMGSKEQLSRDQCMISHVISA